MSHTAWFNLYQPQCRTLTLSTFPALASRPIQMWSMTSTNNINFTNIWSLLSICPQAPCSLRPSSSLPLSQRQLALAFPLQFCIPCSSLNVAFRYTRDQQQVRLHEPRSILLDGVADTIIALPVAPWHSLFPNCHFCFFMNVAVPFCLKTLLSLYVGRTEMPGVDSVG